MQFFENMWKSIDHEEDNYIIRKILCFEDTGCQSWKKMFVFEMLETIQSNRLKFYTGMLFGVALLPILIIPLEILQGVQCIN